MKESKSSRTHVRAVSLLLLIGALTNNSFAAPGDVDLSFDPDTLGINGRVNAVVVQPDGKLLIGGWKSPQFAFNCLRTFSVNPILTIPTAEAFFRRSFWFLLSRTATRGRGDPASQPVEGRITGSELLLLGNFDKRRDRGLLGA